MKRLILTICFIGFAGLFYQEIWAVEKDDLEIIAEGINRFSFNLYKKIKDEKKEENLFYSPASISIALAMTYAGARGNTEKQMADVLNFTLPHERLHSAYSKLIELLRSTKDYELSIANALWLQKDYKYLKEFLNIMKKYYKGGLNEVDFRKDPDGARIRINNWVSQETKEKIKEMLSPQDITPLTRLVLTNAIYFKGKWVSEFNKDFTNDEDFYLINKQKIKVKMMYQENYFKYYENETFQQLEMPYKGDKVSMVIILPKKGKELDSVENIIDEKRLKEWINSERRRKVKAYIPRFKFTQSYDLSQNLFDMGMIDAFEPMADFSGINGQRGDFYISKVIHKAFIDVNEEGTEAAAATAVIMSGKSIMIDKPVIFKADHPFIFLIRDKVTGCILFMGRVMNPNKE